MSDDLKVTVRGRLLGGAVWEKKPNKNNPDKEEYTACVVLDDGEEAKIEAIRDAAILETFGKKKPKGLQDWTVREGDDEEYEHSFEKFFINPKSTRDIAKKVKRGGKVMDISEDEDLIYPGANIAISVSAYAYEGDKKAGIKPGVTLNARAIMFLSHNDRLTDQVSDDEFDDFESLENEDFDDDDWGDEE